MLNAEESKIIRLIEDESSYDVLQRYIFSITNWTKEWRMKLDSIKCKVYHFAKM